MDKEKLKKLIIIYGSNYPGTWRKDVETAFISTSIIMLSFVVSFFKYNNNFPSNSGLLMLISCIILTIIILLINAFLAPQSIHEYYDVYKPNLDEVRNDLVIYLIEPYKKSTKTSISPIIERLELSSTILPNSKSEIKRYNFYLLAYIFFLLMQITFFIFITLQNLPKYLIESNSTIKICFFGFLILNIIFSFYFHRIHIYRKNFRWTFDQIQKYITNALKKVENVIISFRKTEINSKSLDILNMSLETWYNVHNGSLDYDPEKHIIHGLGKEFPNLTKTSHWLFHFKELKSYLNIKATMNIEISETINLLNKYIQLLQNRLEHEKYQNSKKEIIISKILIIVPIIISIIALVSSIIYRN